MRTDDLIRALASDAPGRRVPLHAGLVLALAVGLVAAFALFMAMLGPRSDIGTVSHDPRFLLKFVVTLALAASAAGLVLRLVRPGAPTGLWRFAVWLGPVLLGLGIAYELLSVPAQRWWPRLVGTNSMICLASIPLLAAPLLASLFVALKQGAPMRPALAGAVAGLVAGSFGAALYAAHCIDDSPLFVTFWYGLAIAAVTLVGAALGARVLRW
jgi:hypothetical protein